VALLSIKLLPASGTRSQAIQWFAVSLGYKDVP
jgi:hypothetical protein